MAERASNSSYSLRTNNKQKYRYTKGFEYSLDGQNYVGEYHIVGNKVFTGPEPSNTSKQLTKYYTNSDLYAYDKARKFEERDRVEPDQYVFVPTKADYTTGFVTRYFVERVGRFEGYPLEIDKQQAEKYGRDQGIDEGAYNLVAIKWMLVGYERSTTINNIVVEGVYEHNLREVTLATKIIPNLPEAIKSYTEFARFLNR